MANLTTYTGYNLRSVPEGVSFYSCYSSRSREGEEGQGGREGEEVMEMRCPPGQDALGSHFKSLHCDTLCLSLVEGPAAPKGSGWWKLLATAVHQRCLIASYSYRLPTKVSLIVRHSPGATRENESFLLFFPLLLMTSNPTQ